MRSSICIPAVLLAICLFDGVTLGQDAIEGPQKLVNGPMAKLTPLLGEWEINAVWANGSPLWARNEYTVGVGGRFVEARTFAKNPQSGKIYQRYLTVFGYEEDKEQYTTWGFTYDGREQVVHFTVTEEDGETIITSEWEQAPGTSIRQSVTITAGSDAYGWKIWQKSGDNDWEEIMDGQWKRVGASS